MRVKEGRKLDSLGSRSATGCVFEGLRAKKEFVGVAQSLFEQNSYK